MHDLEITWPEGSARYTPEDSPVRIGRSPDAEVILTEPSVSRRHIEFVWSGSAWRAADESTHGSFDPIGVRLAPSWTVGTDTTVRLGGIEGVEIRVELITTRPEPEVGPVGSPPSPEVIEVPPAPPGLHDVVAPDVAPSQFDAPAPAAFEAPFDRMAASGLPPAPPANNGAGFEAPASDQFPPAPFDGTEPNLAPPPAPMEPAAFEAAPSAFDAPPSPDARPAPEVPPAPHYDAAPSAFDAPPSPDARPPSPDVPPAPEVPPAPRYDAAPSAFDPPPAPEVPPAVGFDPAPPAFDPPPAPSFDAPPAFDPPPAPEVMPAPNVDAPAPAPSAFDPQAPNFAPTPGTAGGQGFDQPAFGDSSPPQPGWDPPTPDALGPAPQQPGDFNPAATGILGGPSVVEQASATIITDSTIQLSIDGKDYTFLPGTEITVGRDPSCLVPVEERHSLVSRHHLKITHRDDDWWVEDTSSKGTFVDGKALTKPYRAQGAFVAHLGDDDAGTPLRVITEGEHRVAKRANLALLIAIAVIALLALGALAFAIRGRGESSEPVETSSATPTSVAAEGDETSAADVAAAELARAKQSTVLLQGGSGVGSGFFVTDKLILTNQHVAVLADTLFVAVSRESDEPAVFEFTANVVANHPYLDIAVLEVVGDEDGNSVDAVGLPPVRFGESGAITLGDQVYNTGFPANLSVISRDDMGLLQLPPVSLNRGQAASFSLWPGCSNPDQESFIPFGSPEGVKCSDDGDVAKGIILTNFASGQGASGSPVFRGDEVIAVVFAGPLDEANAGRNIATDAFKDWLDGVLLENG